jgi:serine/threonine-protein kinase
MKPVPEDEASAVSVAQRTTAGLGTNETSTEIDSSELPVADPLIGTIVAGRYRIIEPLGRGGMGVVYRVEHARIGKLMALKLLTGELSRDQEVVARFKREALMVSKLSHPNTVQVFDFGVSEGLTYLAMEYLRGDDLGRIVRKTGPLSPERCSRVIIQVCSSLAEAHEIGIVHRDLKPENIFILSGQPGNDVVKVLDFGLAKLRESQELGEVTSRGAIVGTPYYMSPEQIRGEAADPRSDVYSLGALMYAALTGEPVFDAPRPMGVLTKHLTDRPVSPSSRFPSLGIPPGMSAVVMRALEKNPEQRFQTVTELQEALVAEVRRFGLSSSVDLLLDSSEMQALTRATDEAATRDEVEGYERKLRRRGVYTWVGVGGVACGAIFAGWQLLRTATATPEFDGREREPNNGASEANGVPFSQSVRGQIGQRLDTERSDRDFYRIAVPKGTSSVSLETTALPNMAMCTFVYRAGIETPLGRYCTGEAGETLRIPVLELAAGEYLFGVMQDRDSYDQTAIPVLENVSDS